MRTAGLIPLETRFLHNPNSLHGYVGAALSSNIIHFTKVSALRLLATCCAEGLQAGGHFKRSQLGRITPASGHSIAAGPQGFALAALETILPGCRHCVAHKPASGYTVWSLMLRPSTAWGTTMGPLSHSLPAGSPVWRPARCGVCFYWRQLASQAAPQAIAALCCSVQKASGSTRWLSPRSGPRCALPVWCRRSAYVKWVLVCLMQPAGYLCPKSCRLLNGS